MLEYLSVKYGSRIAYFGWSIFIVFWIFYLFIFQICTHFILQGGPNGELPPEADVIPRAVQQIFDALESKCRILISKKKKKMPNIAEQACTTLCKSIILKVTNYNLNFYCVSRGKVIVISHVGHAYVVLFTAWKQVLGRLILLFLILMVLCLSNLPGL